MAKRKPKAAYHHGDLRSALLEAATKLVREHGPAGFSLREAAREVGVDPAACYRHFRDRGDLLLAIAQLGFEALAAEMAQSLAAVAEAPYVRRFSTMGRVYVRFAIQNPAQFRVMFGESGTHARDPRLRLPTVERTAYEQLEALIAAWVRDEAHGVAPDRAAWIFWSGVHGVARLVVDGALALPLDEALGLADELAVRLCAGYSGPG
ncbi:MAG: TetR/AcrR family transcriptional regulator [Myxococcales bacterium]|nr:TetR/AcrR family transcriptional regulator [Myxococcales bacterium]